VTRRRALLAPVLLVALAAPEDGHGAARARVGGTLRVALLPEVRADRAGETPEGAVVRGLLASPLCRLGPATTPQDSPFVGFSRSGDALLLAPRPGVRFASGTDLRVQELARSFLRELDRSPVARGLLAPVREARAALERAAAEGGTSLALPLLHPWPDLEASLCHPVFTPALGDSAEGIGPYQADGADRGRASPTFIEGRPFPDALALSTLSRRAAQRALESRSAQVLLGDGAEPPSTALFATYLVFREPARAVVAGFLPRLDRAALVRSFVGGHALPLPGLLPPTLGGPDRPSPSAAAARGSGTAVLLYADRPAQRAVAERLQILLRDAGVRLTLAPRSPEALDRDWSGGQGDLALRSVLLPPLPAPALAVVLELSGDAAASRRELAPLGAVADAQERAARARERALQLAGTLPVVPLYVEALRARLDPALVDVRRDGSGLLVLDDAWWP
jgi:MarR-like DNA-binding transcriptional regulator SgrR of sgrS sRNA